MRPVCANCGREMYPKRNGVLVYHLYQHPTPGPISEDTGGFRIVHLDRLLEGSWEDGDVDYIVLGDEYTCDFCGSSIITGFGEPIEDGEMEQEKMKAMIKKAKRAIEVKK